MYADEFHQVVGAAFAGGAPNPVNAAVVFEAGDLGGTEFAVRTLSDINGDGIVDVLDLLAVIVAWGSC